MSMSKFASQADFWQDRAIKVEQALVKLQAAVQSVYFAAYWHADRPVDEKELWTALRDAAGIQPGQTAERLGPDRSSCERS